MRRILDAKYEKSDLNKVMITQCQHPNTKERKRLLNSKYNLKRSSTFQKHSTDIIRL